MFSETIEDILMHSLPLPALTLAFVPYKLYCSITTSSGPNGECPLAESR